jgi:NAD(P)-dependent dehydrogenase (short-subunit alcohol dehydrogenase family)
VRHSTIVITGAAAGIGRACALLFADARARLILLDRHGRATHDVAAEARRSGASDALAIPCDVSDEDQVRAALHACVARLGPPTGLVANAGIEVNAPAHRMELRDWSRVLDVNLTGVFLSCKYTLAAMLAAGQGGSIVCTSSPSAFVGFAGGGNGAYGASKGGISALVRSLAVDYARHGVRVNAVVPGSTDTDLLYADAPAGERQATREQVERQASEQIPLGRLADPREVAYAIRWLLSSEASYVTGSHLVCDGGLLAKSANTF